MKKSTAVVAMAVSMIGLVIYFWAKTPSLNSSERTRVAAEQSTEIKRELQDLKEQMNELRAERAQMTSFGSERVLNQPSVLTTNPEGAATQEELEAKSEAEMQRYRERLETTLFQQGRDVRWASETEHQIEATVSAAGAAMTLEEARCGATLCKVVVTLGDGGSRRDLVSAIASREPFNNGTLYSYSGSVATMYVAKNGVNFPNANQ